MRYCLFALTALTAFAIPVRAEEVKKPDALTTAQMQKTATLGLAFFEVDAANDAFATGQVPHFLNIAGVKADAKEMNRGRAFLPSTQKEAGSWPMANRGHPGVTPGKFDGPIIHLGSAWATIALTHCAPK